MENLYYNLSEEEFSRGRKILLWGFAGLFFLAGIYVLFVSLILGKASIPPVLSAAPFAICLVVGLIAFFATMKTKDQFFSIDNDKIEFKYGFFKPRKHSFMWADVKGLVMPQKQKKAMLLFNDGSVYVINLTWLHKKKSSLIRKQIYRTASEKEVKIEKVSYLKPL